jgi:PAS domain S-box-containing protein
VTRYGLAVVSVAVALGLSLTLQYYQFRDVAMPLLIFPIAVTTWYAGNGPAVTAIVLSSLCFAYFFAEPYYSFAIASSELPYFFIFVIWGITVAGFSAVRRRTEQSLHQAQAELAERAVDLQAANNELEAFAHSILHDLGAPLGHVVEYAELLQRHVGSALDETASRYLKTLLETVKRMGNLIDDLLGFSCIFVRDMNDVITYWNRGAEELYGWSAQDAIGKKSRELLRTVVPEASAEALDALLTTDRWEGELIETKADGTQVVVASRWSLRRDDQGQPAAVLVTKNDITARKEEIVTLNRALVERAEDLRAANDELRTARDRLEREVERRTQQAHLLDLTHDCIFVRDMNDVITYWNRGAEELYGWSAQDAVGKKSRELLRTVVPEASAEALDALLTTDRWEGELIETRADGAKVVVASRWSLQRDDQGQPAAVLVTKNDITARKHREEEIIALNRELVKHAEDLGAANKELESFAYSVSHDLRAPLRHVIGYAELLQKQAPSSLDEKSRRYMKTILESAKRMGALIDDLLGFSRIGRADTNKTTVDLGQLVREVIAELRPQIGDRDIAWNLGALPACHGDRAMLKVALVNLISNAVKFSRHRARAEIAIGSTEGQHNQIELFVRDNGAGFDMRHADKLFGVFQRLHLAEEFEGTGIGLATVQRIIHRLGGTVRAEGRVDQGATFYLSLPRA